MKKRSLFAAVAMLIVSAIVLTSATYAWFASSNQASMGTFTAGIQNTGGAITISADGQEFKTTLAQADFYVGGDITGSIKQTADAQFPATLTAVSFDPATQNAPAVAGSYSGTTFSGTAAPNDGTGYVKYAIIVKADAACTVNVTLTSSQSSAAPYIWAAIKGTTAPIIVNGNAVNSAARQYVPATAVAAGGTSPVDADGDWVIDASEATGTNVTLGSAVSASGTNNNAMGTLVFTEAGTKTITVYEWAEGQDAACNGTINGQSTISVSFQIAT